MKVDIYPTEWVLRKRAMTAKAMEGMRNDMARADWPELGCRYQVNMQALAGPNIEVVPYPRESKVPGEEAKAYFTNAEVGKLKKFFDDFFKRPETNWDMLRDHTFKKNAAFLVSKLYFNVPQWDNTIVEIRGFMRENCRLVKKSVEKVEYEVVCDDDEGQEHLEFDE